MVALAFFSVPGMVLAGNYIPDGYRIDTVATPKGKPFHVTGLDVCDDNKVYAAIRYGEVWSYDDGRWSMFAEGLHEPTGLLCDGDDIVVAHKPELTKIVDTNHDGIANDYVMLSDAWSFHDNYHEFTFGPVKDKRGNYYGTLNLSHDDPNAFSLGTMGSSGGYRGFAFKVDKKGRFTPFAWGLRSPAGIGISPKNELFFTDNQGDWVATSTFHLLQEGRFYGHPISLIDRPGYTREKIKNMSADDFDAIREKPVAWIPHIDVANSPGNPEWDTSKGRFGPFAGQIFVGDQTQSNVFRVILDKVNGKYQGAVINFINGFQSGNIRLSFDDDGQLWVGQTARGWGAKGGKPFGLQKVVWDGTNPFELYDIHITPEGFNIRFTDALDADTVNVSSFAVQQWHYHYSGDYGSPKVDLKSVDIESVRQTEDRGLEVALPLEAGKVIQVSFKGLKDKNGREPSVTDVYYTVNELPD